MQPLTPRMQRTLSTTWPGGQIFSLLHLELLHHLASNFGDLAVKGCRAHNFLNTAIRQACQVPYLMNQLLGVSATQMSTLRPDKELFYRMEATRLQTCGLMLFNAARATTSEDSLLAVFLFSVLISQQATFEALSNLADLPACLDTIVGLLNLSAGVRTVACSFWAAIDAQFSEESGTGLPAAVFGIAPTAIDEGPLAITKHIHLVEMINRADLSSSSAMACLHAIQILEYLDRGHAALNALSIGRINLILQWQYRVSDQYVQLISHRQPEALVILAYYAMLIHEVRSYWLYGDSGKCIIQSVDRYLGPA